MSQPACVGFRYLGLAVLSTGALTTNGTGSEQLVPDLVTPRSDERTGFQEAGPYRPRSDLRTDFVMAYGVDSSLPDRLRCWQEAGYVPQVMTGVAWGEYQEFLDGQFDGRDHWDESQTTADGKPILHGPKVPYMVPSVAFSKFLEVGIRRAIDGGAVAVHLEEPEFWREAGSVRHFNASGRSITASPGSVPIAVSTLSIAPVNSSTISTSARSIGSAPP